MRRRDLLTLAVAAPVAALLPAAAPVPVLAAGVDLGFLRSTSVFVRCISTPADLANGVMRMVVSYRPLAMHRHILDWSP